MLRTAVVFALVLAALVVSAPASSALEPPKACPQRPLLEAPEDARPGQLGPLLPLT